MDDKGISNISLGHTPDHYGTSFEDAIRYVPKNEAQRAFIEKDLQQIIADMPVEDFAQRVKVLELPQERIEQLLRYMPDKERAHARTLIEDTEESISVGRGQYIKLAPKFVRGKRPIKLPTLTPQRLAQIRAEQARELDEETSEEAKRKVRGHRDDRSVAQ